MDTILNGVARIFNGNSIAVGDVYRVEPGLRTFQVVLHGLVAGEKVSGTVNIDGSNDGVNFVNIATVAITNGVDGTASATEGFVSDAPWGFVRASVTALSGSVSVFMGV